MSIFYKEQPVEMTNEPMPSFEGDFWENPKFNFLEKTNRNFVIFLVFLLCVIGGYAAKEFNRQPTKQDVFEERILQEM